MCVCNDRETAKSRPVSFVLQKGSEAGCFVSQAAGAGIWSLDRILTYSQHLICYLALFRFDSLSWTFPFCNTD